jgi:SSS family transporter
MLGQGILAADMELDWKRLPDLPDELGVAGPFVGVHEDRLFVAGGANFSRPVWEQPKVWRDAVYVLEPDGQSVSWRHAGTLSRPLAYGAAVSTPDGVLCIGGNDAETTYARVFLLRWDAQRQELEQIDYPALPVRCAYAQAAMIGNVIFVAGGQTGAGLETATTNSWSLDLSQQTNSNDFRWQPLPPWPGPPRAFHLTVAQHNGYETCIYVIGGRRQRGESVEFLQDVWQYAPRSGTWQVRASLPRPVVAGAGYAWGQSHLFVLSGDDGSLFSQTDILRDNHPGFPREAFAYHTITDTWTGVGDTPANHVTTTPVMWRGGMIVASGEVRPRVRTPAVWSVTAKPNRREFGTLNYSVLLVYLLSMLAVGAYFARRNRNTDDYFRGGKHIPWWAAGCSIFATMLSSLTFTGIPSKAFAQDWVYAIGNFMVPIVAVVGVYIALPTYRRIDATSAYEYLEKRFSRPVRLFGSASFTLFHLFRMAVVMSLTGLALAVATPLTPVQSVLLMGTLSIAYCTMGGIEAVIWTDTLQTVVLMGGALLALIMLLLGNEQSMTSAWHTATSTGKLNLANWHADMTHAELAIWVVVLGGIGQNISSYTADQAVVQRYMTTSSERLAARSIWTNAVLTIPATLLFFGMGTALYLYYRAHPQKLDPTISTDQIFPLFIANEMPVGIAGLIVAGIFAAAQSTVSTSMNSTATTLITDFLRPLHACRTEAGYLRAARLLTLFMGVLGTLLALVFVDPRIKSLFDAFIQVIGLFMGVLGGLFVLGIMTRRATSTGALIGATVGTALMFSLWRFTNVTGYIYTAIGIATCVVVGYLASLLGPPTDRDLEGLTIYTIDRRAKT